ncbi:Asp-tRNA(Asn)/Glu-tRNA(Gln) amidotransferase subunit GatC [Hahella sp. SMD15-11]|uniref:Aspartyl/glutamyl-tRNA(Asn/Gln) amidotransferase subunit C n=1 Tax=Thermohahella caldifontis TaxID=3142973 RepID=A0AB39UXZ9_9GAMM
MAIDKTDLDKIAYLARLSIDPAQADRVLQDMDRILDFVDQMQQVDTTGIEPLAHPIEARQRLREDRVTESNQREALLKNAPATENGLFLVPKVIE